MNEEHKEMSVYADKVWATKHNNEFTDCLKQQSVTELVVFIELKDKLHIYM